MDFSLDTVESARLVAAAAAVLAMIGVSWVAVSTYQKYRSFQRIFDAAALLLGVHMDAVAEKSEVMATRMEGTGEAAAEMTRHTRRFAADLRELRYLVRLVSEEKERLKSAVIDLVLPTGSRRRA
jgi:hypothetical protein